MRNLALICTTLYALRTRRRFIQKFERKSKRCWFLRKKLLVRVYYFFIHIYLNAVYSSVKKCRRYRNCPACPYHSENWPTHLVVKKPHSFNTNNDLELDQSDWEVMTPTIMTEILVPAVIMWASNKKNKEKEYRKGFFGRFSVERKCGGKFLLVLKINP